MFPREITTSSLWIRHQLPLCARMPINGDKKLRRQIQVRLVQATETEIDDAVRLERARLDLKWCLDEFFGGPLSEFSLGQIATVNVIGVVHLAYIVDITSSCVTVISADTFGSVAKIGYDDVYSGEHSPFLYKHLRQHCVYQPQHVLDWWTRCTAPQQHVSSFHFEEISSLSACSDALCDWPIGEETWFTHDALPQRSQFVHCHAQVIHRTLPANSVEYCVHSFPSSVLSNSGSLPLNSQSSDVLHCSHASAEHHLSASIPYACADLSSSGVPNVHRSSIHASVSKNHLLFDHPLAFIPFLQRPHAKQFFLSILALFFIAALYSSVIYDIEPSSIILSSKTLLGSPMSIHVFLLFVFNNQVGSQLLGYQTLLHNVNQWDWFRTLAVP